MERGVQTIFCDDIRHEVGGKISFIGVYSEALLVPSFPITLPKLCLSIKIITPAERPFLKVAIRILKDDEVMAEAALDDAMLAKIVEDAGEVPKDQQQNRVQALQSIMVFSPFQLDRPCLLRVRVDSEEGEHKGLGLRVRAAPIEPSVPNKQPN